jgi:hypothetical protein
MRTILTARSVAAPSCGKESRRWHGYSNRHRVVCSIWPWALKSSPRTTGQPHPATSRTRIPVDRFVGVNEDLHRIRGCVSPYVNS